MLISAVEPFTMLDYPNKTACILFTAGCNFRCGFCHNPEFVLPDKIKEIQSGFIPESVFISFLTQRQGLLDGVVISGGEPTMMPDLENMIVKIKSLGFLVKLDTNGNRPDILESLYNKKLLDYVAMDLKVAPDQYRELVGARAVAEQIENSISLIMQSNKPYEFRSTLIKEIHVDYTLRKMSEAIKGAERICLQTFRPATTLDPKFSSYQSFSGEELHRIGEEYFRNAVQTIEVR